MSHGYAKLQNEVDDEAAQAFAMPELSAPAQVPHYAVYPNQQQQYMPQPAVVSAAPPYTPNDGFSSGQVAYVDGVATVVRSSSYERPLSELLAATFQLVKERFGHWLLLGLPAYFFFFVLQIALYFTFFAIVVAVAASNGARDLPRSVLALAAPVIPRALQNVHHPIASRAVEGELEDIWELIDEADLGVAIGVGIAIFIIASLVIVLAQTMVIVPTVHGMQAYYTKSNTNLSFGEVWRASRHRICPTFGTNMAAQIIIIIGLLMFIIPGIIANIMLILAPLLTIIEHRDVGSSLRGSRQLIRGRWWRTFFFILILTIIVGAVSMVLRFLLGLMGIPPVYQVPVDSIVSVFEQILVCAGLVVYYNEVAYIHAQHPGSIQI